MRLLGLLTLLARTSAVSIIIIAALLIQAVPHVYSQSFLDNREDKTSSSVAGETADHMIAFDINDLTILGSIDFEFCENNPIPNTPCTPPSGFDASAAVLSQQSGETGFTIHPGSTANRLILTRVSTIPSPGRSSYEFQNVANPDNPGSYYIRIRTFSSDNATGPTIEEGGIALSISSSVTVSTEVPPYLTFCSGLEINGLDCATAAGQFINFGEFSPTETRSANSQFLVATNAPTGYSVTLAGGTLTSGSNFISALVSQTPSLSGTSQFGLNLRANTVPPLGSEPVGPGTATPTANYNTANLYKFVNGDVIASSVTPNDTRKFTVSYIANVSASQDPGIYNTTVSFICLANF